MTTDLSKLPFCRKGQWAEGGPYILVRLVKETAWLLRLSSPAAWISPFFQIKRDEKTYTHHLVAEIYSLISIALSVVLLSVGNDPKFRSSILAIWGCIVIFECLHYQLRTIFLRPLFQENYEPYSPQRTLLILSLQYLNTALAFALIYLSSLSNQIITTEPTAISSLLAVEFSITTITTLGYGNIHPAPGSIAASLAAAEALMGVFMLGVIISTAVGRQYQQSTLKS